MSPQCQGESKLGKKTLEFNTFGFTYFLLTCIKENCVEKNSDFAHF